MPDRRSATMWTLPVGPGIPGPVFEDSVWPGPVAFIMGATARHNGAESPRDEVPPVSITGVESASRLVECTQPAMRASRSTLSRGEIIGCRSVFWFATLDDIAERRQ